MGKYISQLLTTSIIMGVLAVVAVPAMSFVLRTSSASIDNNDKILSSHDQMAVAEQRRLNAEWLGGIQKIIIDAGHGGKDGGCSGKHSKEKNITLKIALKLGEYIKKNLPSVTVIYTRKKDVFVPLHKRAALANKHHADLFISIHCNAVPKITAQSRRVQGTETFVMGLHRAKDNLEVAKRENQVILLEDNYEANYSGFDPNSPEGHIMLSMYQNAYLEQSIELASLIEGQFKKRAKRISRGVKQAGFVVLRETTMPSVLIEAGFLTHLNEEKFLKTSHGQDLIASGIFRAFRDYKNAYENKATQIAGVAKGSSKVPTAKLGKGIVFKLQLGASSKVIDTSRTPWNKVEALEVIQLNGINKYLVGTFDNYAACAQLQQYWRKHGFKDAFIVAFKDGQPISVSKAKEAS